MSPEGKAMITWGARVFGLGVIALGLVSLAWGEFDFGQSVPKDFPFRTVLAYAAAVFMLVAGAALEWRQTVKWGAAALAVYFALFVVVLMGGRVIIAHYAEYGAYSSVAAQVAVACGALIIYAGNMNDAPAAARLTRVARGVFGFCAVLFGGAHFFYLNLTVPLVPTWLPPSQEFWAYATGIAHIAAGVALLTGIQARLAAILLTIMYASFTPLVHVPMVMADSSSHFNWSENALNVILTGIAWVVADSLSKEL
jgi:uncharacterized membrane protein YphA (DoxX/SURF4 family)